MILSLLVTVALAQERTCSPGTYDEARLQGALERAEAALFSGDVDPARAELSEAHREVLCLPGIARPSQVSRLSRDLALAFFFDQDEDATRRWALASRYAGAMAWEEGQFPEGHPFRDAMDLTEDPIIGGADGKGLVYPKKGAVFASGKLLAAPKAPAEVPLLVQVADKDGVIVNAWWQDGAAFPDAMIGPPGPPPVAPKWWVPEAAGSAPVAAVEPEPAVAEAEPEPEPAVAEAEPAPEPEPTKPEATKPVKEAKAPKPEAAKPVKEPKPAKPEPTKPVEVPTVAAVAATKPADPPPDAVAAPPPPPGAYVDPFSDARRRALAREISSREHVDAKGNRSVVTTEVIRFASDPSGGAPVSAKHYAEWLVDFPEWAPGGEMAKRSADEGYLKGWKDAKTPPDPAAPATWVSFAAASAYCGSWGNRVAQVEQASADALAREWRESAGKPVWKSKDGSAAPAEARVTAADVGFRCAP